MPMVLNLKTLICGFLLVAILMTFSIIFFSMLSHTNNQQDVPTYYPSSGPKTIDDLIREAGKATEDFKRTFTPQDSEDISPRDERSDQEEPEQ